MAKVHRSPALPDNVVDVDLHDPPALAQRAYEAGHLLVLRAHRIEADLDFFAAMRVDGDEDKHKKFFLTHPRHYAVEANRDAVWRDFRRRAFPAGLHGARRFRYFRAQVGAVNEQIFDLAQRVFPRYRTAARMVAWKFQHVLGENMHIDNIDHCERYARLRVFVNLGRTHRVWAISDHVRRFAAEWFERADLGRFAGRPYEFNQTLSAAAFGTSREAALSPCPRHYLYFEPGEVWFLNSMVTAHQVLYGDRLAVASFPFPYSDYADPSQALPAIVDALCASRGAAQPV